MTDQPHLLSIYLTVDGGIDFSIACPVEGQEGIRCALWEQCLDAHPQPEEPDLPEPKFVTDPDTLQRTYSADSIVEAVIAWERYYELLDQYEEEHRNGFHRTTMCWLRETVANGSLDDQWELKGFTHQLVTGPLPVDWDNAGDLEDSFLVILPHQPKEPDADRETVHDPAHVGCA